MEGGFLSPPPPSSSSGFLDINGKQPHVLAVDDNLVDRKLIEKLLQNSSCKGDFMIIVLSFLKFVFFLNSHCCLRILISKFEYFNLKKLLLIMVYWLMILVQWRQQKMDKGHWSFWDWEIMVILNTVPAYKTMWVNY